MRRNFRYLSEEMSLLHVRKRLDDAIKDDEIMVLTIMKSDYWEAMKDMIEGMGYKYARHRRLDRDGIWGVKIWGWK